MADLIGQGIVLAWLILCVLGILVSLVGVAEFGLKHRRRRMR